MRGQTELPVLGIAFVLVTGALVVGVSVADDAFRTAERPALEQRAAAGLADRLVSADAGLTERENVLNASRLPELDPGRLEDRYGLPDGAAVEVRLDGETRLSRGDPTAGTRVKRLVGVEVREERTISPPFDATDSVVVPRRTDGVELAIRPANATVETVTANGRVVLHNASGLFGSFELSLSRYETATLVFNTEGELNAGDVSITYQPTTTRKAVLAVIVDA